MLGKCRRFELQEFDSFARVFVIHLKSASHRNVSGDSLSQIPTDWPDFYLFKNKIEFLSVQCETAGFGGLGVACWPLVTNFAGSNPA